MKRKITERIISFLTILIIMLVGQIFFGCALRTSNYTFDDENNGVDPFFSEGYFSYFEGEIASERWLDYFELSWGIGHLNSVSRGDVDYSTEDRTYFYPHDTEALDATMWDTRLTGRVYPAKSIQLGQCSFAPYVGMGYGYFWGEVEHNYQGDYLGNDIHGTPHYGLKSSSFDFDGTFSSYSFGLEFQIHSKKNNSEQDAEKNSEISDKKKNKNPSFFLIEYRKDEGKEDADISFDASQIFFGFGFKL